MFVATAETAWESIRYRFGLRRDQDTLAGIVNGTPIRIARPELRYGSLSEDGAPGGAFTPITTVEAQFLIPLDLLLTADGGYRMLTMYGVVWMAHKELVRTGDLVFDSSWRVGCQEAWRGAHIFNGEVRELLQGLLGNGMNVLLDDHRITLTWQGHAVAEADLTRAIAQAVLAVQAVERARTRTPPPRELFGLAHKLADFARREGLEVGAPLLIYGTTRGSRVWIHSVNTGFAFKGCLRVWWREPVPNPFRLVTRAGGTLERYGGMIVNDLFGGPQVADPKFRLRFRVEGGSRHCLQDILTKEMCAALASLWEERLRFELDEEGIALQKPYCDPYNMEYVFSRFMEIVELMSNQHRRERPLGPYR